MILKFNKEELKESFDSLLDDAIKSRLRKDIDKRIDKKLTEIISTKISDKYIKGKIHTAVINIVDKNCKSLVFETVKGGFGLYFPYNFNKKYDKLLVDKIFESFDKKDLEKAIKQSIKTKVMQGLL